MKDNPTNRESSQLEWQKLKLHSLIPAIILVLIWSVKIFETLSGYNLSFLGVFPGKWSGVFGIITMPLVHGDWNHLISNSFPFAFLSIAVFYLHKDLGYKVFLIIWIVAGLLTWLIARPSWHIGASGLVYGLAFYLFFSGIISKDYRLWAFSLLISFLYGSLVWGIFPYDSKISHEGHAAGAISGIMAALLFRKQIPGRAIFDWELEDEDYLLQEDGLSADTGNISVQDEDEVDEKKQRDSGKDNDPNLRIKYFFKLKDGERI